MFCLYQVNIYYYFIDLRELYASFNDISDLGPLTLHDKIEVLDLESNKITNINDVFLKLYIKD